MLQMVREMWQELEFLWWLFHLFIGGDEFEKETFAELNHEIQKIKIENVHLKQQIRKLERLPVVAPVTSESVPVQPCAKVTCI